LQLLSFTPDLTTVTPYTIVEFSRLGTNVEVCVVVFWGATVGSVVGLVFSVAAWGATLLEGDSRKGFSIGMKLDFKLWGRIFGA